MSTTDVGCRIYVACLAAYNGGRLHGAWLDADQEPDELHDAVRAILARSPVRGAEEWALHDYEGFGDWKLGEYESLDRVSLVARAAADRGRALLAFVANDESVLDGVEDVEELGSKFDERYAGEWVSTEEWAREYVEEVGLPGAGFVYPEQASYSRERRSWSDVLGELDLYLDWDAIANALLADCWTADAGGGSVWVFRSY